MACGDTGTTVIGMEREGQFDGCQNRTHICGYACCKFDLNNFIYAFPGEIEAAEKQGLSFDHLNVEKLDDGGAKIQCTRPCVAGEFKSIDCAIYGVWIASECGTKFLVADNRKCPVPHNELLELARHAQEICLSWERKYPGTLKGMANAAKDFTAYQPFDHAIELDGTVRKLDQSEIDAITPKELLGDDFIAKFSGVDLDGYSGTSTPEDQAIDTSVKLRPLELFDVLDIEVEHV